MGFFSIADKVNFNINNNNEHMELAKDIVCYNQGKIAEYMYMQQSYSFKLDNDLNNFLNDPDINGIKILQETMKDYKLKSITFLETCINKNLDYAQKYFTNRHNTNSRSCVKLLTKDQKLHDTYRSIKNKPYLYSVNTGFYQIIENGERCYINNDIPDSVKNGRYKNSRIDVKASKNYSLSYKNYINKKLKKTYVDQEWINCWNGYTRQHQSQNNECYKSTLIIPMTLINNELSPNFKLDFFKDFATKDKTILGFLCFDHVETGYFNDYDTKIGFIIADLLSIYYMIDYKMRIHDENYFITSKLLSDFSNFNNSSKFLTQIKGGYLESND